MLNMIYSSSDNPWRYIASFSSFPLVERDGVEEFSSLSADKIHLFVLKSRFSLITFHSVTSESFLTNRKEISSVENLWENVGGKSLSFFEFFQLCSDSQEKKALEKDLRLMFQSKDPRDSFAKDFYARNFRQITETISPLVKESLEMFSCRIYIRAGRCYIALPGPSLLDRIWKDRFSRKEALIGYLNQRVDILSPSHYISHFLSCYTITSLQKEFIVRDYAKKVFPVLHQLRANPSYIEDLKSFRDAVVVSSSTIHLYYEKTRSKQKADFFIEVLARRIVTILSKFDPLSMKNETRQSLLNFVIDKAISRFPEILGDDPIFSKMLKANERYR